MQQELLHKNTEMCKKLHMGSWDFPFLAERVKSVFRLFIDECGHHNMKSADNPNERYLGLTGIIMHEAYASEGFHNALSALKQAIFGRSDFPLHRTDILAADKPPFDQLKEPKLRQRFDDELLVLIESATYRVVTVVIDKKEHKAKYSVWHFQPYHYCMTLLLERYVLFLRGAGEVGDVLAESRGKKDNKRLAKAYRYIYNHGTDNIAGDIIRRWLSSKEIKIKPKSDNIAGLQLADSLANPSCRELICAHTNAQMMDEFGKKVVGILYRQKYRRNPFNGKISGYGTKWLP